MSVEFSHKLTLGQWGRNRNSRSRGHYGPSWRHSLSLSLTHTHTHICIFFLGPHLQHMEVPRLGVKLELQLPAYTTATATQMQATLQPTPQPTAMLESLTH